MNALISQIKSNNLDLKNAEIAGILYILLQNQEITNNELITLTGLPKETVRTFKSSIASMLDNLSEDKILLKPESRVELEKMDLSPYKWTLIDYKNTELETKILEIRQKYNINPERNYDQFFATVQTSAAKAQILKDKDLIHGKRIALLGDDDLVSICIALVDSSYANITVFDIDQRLLDLINSICSDLGIKNVQTFLYDSRKNLRSEHLAKFDVVVTDPPYTKTGINLFTNRCIELLGKQSNYDGKYIFLYYGNSFKSPEKTLKVQELISTFNLVIEDKVDKFAHYNGAESIGNASSLYILKTTPYTQRLEESLLSTSIYTFENQKEEKFPFVDHYVFKLNNVPKRLLNSKRQLQNAADQFCKEHKLTFVERKITRFKGGGYTLTYILSSSNLLIHTWEEYDALHIDLITCSPLYNKDALGFTLSKLFETKSIEIKRVE